MTERVREILSWYSSDTAGTRTNIARLLNHGRLGGTGRLVILPVDQGFEHGPARSFAPNPPAYDPRYHFDLASVELTAGNLKSYDCVLIATNHDAFDYDAIYAHASLIVDTRGVYREKSPKVVRA